MENQIASQAIRSTKCKLPIPGQAARTTRSVVFSTLLAGGAMLVSFVSPVHAGAPMKKSQPGYYRIMVGDYEVTALSDGTTRWSADDVLTGISKEEIGRRLTAAFLGTPLEISINTYLVNTGKKLILIDGGAGNTIDKDSGHLVENLKAAGYEPGQVDEIYLTHMHLDHIGGLSNNGQRIFPNAVVHADRKESAYWLSAKNAATVQRGKRSFTVAPAALQPYIAAGKYAPYDGDAELSPGISSVANYGHTPGHNAYLISSKGQRLLVFGDLVHVQAVQFQLPEVAVGFDADEHEAIADRRRTFDAIADQHELVAAAHISFPGIGHIVKEGNGYRWDPVSYAVPR